jgi:hypothetical protein
MVKNSAVQLEKIIMTDLCHGRKVVLNLKCFEIFLYGIYKYNIRNVGTD